jgi:uncharacterized protein (DUF362 family)
LETGGARTALADASAILIKPNLVTDSPFPVTTRPEFCAAAIRWLRSMTTADIVVGEGCGSCSMETPEVFRALGYETMAREENVRLIDLNHVPLRRVTNESLTIFPEMRLPEIAFTHAIISMPVLKAHSLAGITGSLKNMMGFPPPEHYSGSGGTWKKAVFHKAMQQSIRDLCSYVRPTFTLMDASLGLADHHLGGATLAPPAGVILAGTDARACDRRAATLLGRDWHGIGHLL